MVRCVMRLMSGSVAGSARLALLGTHLLHLMTRRLARYTLSKHGWCCRHDNSSRERDDLWVHVVLLQQTRPSMERNEPNTRSSKRTFIMSVGCPD